MRGRLSNAGKGRSDVVGGLNCETERSSTTPQGVIRVIPFDPTSEGQEFLSNVRSDGVWQRVKGTVTAKGSAFAFGVVNDLATQWALAALKDV